MLDIIRRRSRSLGVKIIFGLIIIVFVFWGASAVNTPSNQTMAKVNGEAIHAMDWQAEFQRTYEMLRGTPEFASITDDQKEELGQLVLSRMITREVVRQEAARLGLGISDIELSYIVNRVQDFAGEDGKFSEELYKQRLGNVGMTPGFYERMLSTDLMTSKLQNYIAGTVSLNEAEARAAFNFEYERRIVDYLLFPATDFTGLVKPTEEAILEYYEQNKNLYAVPAKADMDYLLFDVKTIAGNLNFTDEELESYYQSRQAGFTEPARYRSSHIFLPVDFSGEDPVKALEEAEAKAARIISEYKEGRDFANLAREYSGDARTRDRGGERGWLEQGQSAPEYEEAVLALKPGEISGAVRLPDGLYIVRLEESVPALVKPFAAVKDEVLALKREDEAYRLLDKYLIEVEDVVITTADLGDIGRQYGIPVKHAGNLTIDALAETFGVSPAVFSNLASVKTGSILPVPVELKDAFLVLKLNEYKAGYVPALEEVRGRVEVELREREAFSLAMREADRVYKEIASSGSLPAELRGKVTETPPVDRVTGIAGLGFSPILTESIFAAEPGEWLDTAFSTSDGAVLVRVKSVQTPSEAEWAEQGERYTAYTLANRQNNIFNTYLGLLHKNAKIEVLVDKIFSRN